MHAVAAFVLVCLAGWLLIGALGRARSATAGRAPGGGHGGQRSVRQEAKIAWEKVLATDWLEERRHARKNGDGTSDSPRAVTDGTPARGKPALLRQMAAAAAVPFQRRPGTSLSSGNGTAPAAPAAPPRAAGAPTSASPSLNGSPGRNTTVASTGNAVEKFVEGVNQIHAEAQSGGIHAKQAAIKACHEACVRFAAMSAMLARSMSEPGQNYGPEITEPISKSGTQLQASALTFSEADANLTALINMTVGDLANSGRQAPHHTELSENGSR